jgi:hypothetical protein
MLRTARRKACLLDNATVAAVMSYLHLYSYPNYAMSETSVTELLFGVCGPTTRSARTNSQCAVHGRCPEATPSLTTLRDEIEAEEGKKEEIAFRRGYGHTS